MAKTSCCRVASGGDCGKLEGSFFLSRRQSLLNSRKLLPSSSVDWGCQIFRFFQRKSEYNREISQILNIFSNWLKSKKQHFWTNKTLLLTQCGPSIHQFVTITLRPWSQCLLKVIHSLMIYPSVLTSLVWKFIWGKNSFMGCPSNTWYYLAVKETKGKQISITSKSCKYNRDLELRFADYLLSIPSISSFCHL